MSALSYIVNSLDDVGALKIVNRKGVYTCQMPGNKTRTFRKVYLNGAELPVYVETRKGARNG